MSGGALRPIRLHLDTSDYGAMHAAAHGSSEAQIRDKLKEMVRSGYLEIGLSYHVLFEFLQKATPRYREDRLARAQLLRELCGRNAFPHPIDLGKGYSFSNDGVWFPRSELAFFDVENLLKDLIRTAVQNLPRRGERRALSKRMNFIKWARDNPLRLDALITAQPWSLVLQQRFINPGNLKRYIFGETSRVEANRELLACVVDPATMYETWFEHSDRENPLVVISEKLTGKITTMLTDLRQQVDINIPALRTQIKKAISTHGNNPQARAKFTELQQEVKKERSMILSPQLLTQHTPGGWTKLVGEKSALIAAQILYAFYNEKRSMKRSDAIDLIHAMYLPYTDLWRGDRAFSDLLIKDRVDCCERVVPSLSELQSRIDRERDRGGA